MRPLLLLLAAAPLAPLALHAQRRAPKPAAVAAPAADVVPLTFAWPAGTRATVDSRRVRARHTSVEEDRSMDTSTVVARYRMAVEAADTTLLVRYGDFTFPGLDTLGGPGAPARALLARIGSIVPSVRVDRAGHLLGLESPAAVHDEYERLLAQLTSAAGQLPPVAQEMMRAATSEEALAGAAAQEWNALVGAWIGGRMRLGADYASAGQESQPMAPGVPVTMRYQFLARRRLPCDPAASPAARDCVELQLVATPDSAAVRALVQRMVDTPGAPAGGARFTAFDVRSVTTLVTRPASLLPVHLTITQEVTATVREGGRPQEVYQVDTRELWFRYER